jgi:2-keto-3-deoxy-L-rhamnonate aldolase RhmA
MIDDAATAQAVVNSARYPRQIDATSLGSATKVACRLYRSFCQEVRGEMNPSTCVNTKMICLSWYRWKPRKVCKAISDVLPLKGIDAIFLGPMDLSCSIGKNGFV